MATKIDYDALIQKTPENVWLSGKELEDLWGVPESVRKMRIKVLVNDKKFVRRGESRAVQYRLKTKTPPSTIAPTALDELINAATKLGTENELLKRALLEIKTTTEKALEALQ